MSHLKVRSGSDFHLEFFADAFNSQNISVVESTVNKIIPPLDTDHETVLVLSGDIATVRKSGILINFFKHLLPRFKHVIYVFGNHEHYHGNIHTTFPVFEDLLENHLSEDYSKLTLAGNTPVKVVIDSVTFLCGTLWTDYGGKDAEKVHKLIEAYITDHRAIKSLDGKGVTAKELIAIHTKTVKQFGKWMSKEDTSSFVVCTHHMPSFAAVDPQYMTDDQVTRTLNHAFASNLDDFILQYRPAFWTFGHTHTKFYGKIGNTQLICNPHGYPQEKNLLYGNFDKYNMFEVQKYDRRNRERH